MTTENHPSSPPEDVLPVTPLRKRPRLRRLVTTGLAIAGGAFVVLCLIVPSRTSGATRAYRLKWQQRHGGAPAGQPVAPTAEQPGTATP